MQIELVPTLALMRDLYRMPRDMARFHRYIEAMTNADGSLALPLSGFNPMGRDHVAEAVDHLVAIDAEVVVTRAAEEAARRLALGRGAYRVALVVSDDIGGMWTERTNAEATARFNRRGASLAGWVVPTFWTSDRPTAAAIEAEMIAEIYRTIALETESDERALSAVMRIEGRALRFAGASPGLGRAEIERARTTLDPLGERGEWPVIITAMFGDEVAQQYGYEPLGLPTRAGFEVALADALDDPRAPEAYLQAGA